MGSQAGLRENGVRSLLSEVCVDADSGLPVRDQLKSHIRRWIAGGSLTQGQRLPSMRAMARQAGVSLTTVEKALRELSIEGIVRGHPGKGVFVAGGTSEPGPAAIHVVPPEAALAPGMPEGRRGPDTGSPREEQGRTRAAKEVFTIGFIGATATAAASEANLLAQFSSRAYWYEILRGVTHHAMARNCAILIIPNSSKEPLDFDRLASLQLDCLISHDIRLSEDTVYELRRRGIPLILGNRGDGSLARLGASYVDTDDIGLIRQGMRLLHDHGHERIACLFAETVSGAWWNWRDAFYLEAAALGLRCSHSDYCRIMPLESAQTSTLGAFLAEQTEALLNLPKPPTAILYDVQYPQTRQALALFEERGMRLGQDISAVAHATTIEGVRPPLSVFVARLDIVAQKLVETALDLAHDPHRVFHVDVPFDFQDNGSVAAL